MPSLEEQLRACAARSTDEEVAWQLYVEWEKEYGSVVVPIGPALPVGMVEERVDAGIMFSPCDLGVFFDPLYEGSRGGFIALELGPEPLCVPPAAVVVETDGDQHVLCRSFTGACQLHADCKDHGVLFDYDGDSYPFHECELGSRDVRCLPPPLRDKPAMLPDNILRILHYAELRATVDDNGVIDAGGAKMYGLFARAGDGFDTDDPSGGLKHPPTLTRVMRGLWPWAPPWPDDYVTAPTSPTIPENGGAPKAAPVPSDWGGWRFAELNRNGYFEGTPSQYRQWRLSRCRHGFLYVAGDAVCDCGDAYD